MPGEREYDLILLGATGYTGKLTAHYIFRSLPLDLKWAIAGRDQRKLQAVAESLVPLNPSRTAVDILLVDLTESDLGSLAKSTRLVISTVGPFQLHGSVTFAACARNGTHYIDCTGEAAWLKTMIDKHDRVAKANGSIMIPCCGFDCVPSDLLTWLAADHNRRHFGAGTGRVDLCIHSIKGGISGGTLASVLQAFEDHSLGHLRKVHAPFALSAKQPTPPVPPKPSSLWTKLFGLLRIKQLGWMSYQPQAAVDRMIVHRSWGLLEPTAASYGHSFDWHGWLRAWGPVIAVIWHICGLLLAPWLLLRPVRKILPRLWYKPGTGAAAGTIKSNWFEYRGVAEADTAAQQPKPKTLVRMRYDGDAYVFTAIALGEAAKIVLCQQDTWAHKFGGGVLTPATLGDHYVSHLRDAGVIIEARADVPGHILPAHWDKRAGNVE
ncbi:Saccharopine dehydrogenase-domain-containing protein [Aspergillus insuetus]